MSDFQRCKICGDWDWARRHRCAPTFEVRFHDIKSYGDEWRSIHAHSPESAAAKFAERHDQNGDYDIIQCGEATLDVRKSDEEAFTVYEVAAESVPQYRAEKQRA